MASQTFVKTSVKVQVRACRTNGAQSVALRAAYLAGEYEEFPRRRWSVDLLGIERSEDGGVSVEIPCPDQHLFS